MRTTDDGYRMDRIRAGEALRGSQSRTRPWCNRCDRPVARPCRVPAAVFRRVVCPDVVSVSRPNVDSIQLASRGRRQILVGAEGRPRLDLLP